MITYENKAINSYFKSQYKHIRKNKKKIDEEILDDIFNELESRYHILKFKDVIVIKFKPETSHESLNEITSIAKEYCLKLGLDVNILFKFILIDNDFFIQKKL